MDGDNETLAMAGLAEDVVAALDPFQMPAVAFSHAHEILAGDLLHSGDSGGLRRSIKRL